jgi:uncharacterized phage infection (PIP) family protein YhgE
MDFPEKLTISRASLRSLIEKNIEARGKHDEILITVKELDTFTASKQTTKPYRHVIDEFNGYVNRLGEHLQRVAEKLEEVNTLPTFDNKKSILISETTANYIRNGLHLRYAFDTQTTKAKKKAAGRFPQLVNEIADKITIKNITEEERQKANNWKQKLLKLADELHSLAEEIEKDSLPLLEQIRARNIARREGTYNMV